MYEEHHNEMAEEKYSLGAFIDISQLILKFDCEHAKMCLWETASALRHSLGEMKLHGKHHLLFEAADFEAGSRVLDTWNRVKNMLPCLQAVSGATRKSFATYEVTAGVGFMLESQTVPIWVAVAVQLLLGIQDAIGSVREKPVLEVQGHAQRLISDLKSRKIDQESFDKEVEWLSEVYDVYDLDISQDSFRKMALGGLKKGN